MNESASLPADDQAALQNPASETAAANPADGSGAGGDVGNAALFEKIQRASLGAVEQHLAETPVKRKPGQRGPDRKPRRTPARLPDGRFVPKNPSSLGDASGPAVVDEAPPTPLEAGQAPAAAPVPAFDRDTATALVEIGVGLLNDAAGAIVRAVALRETGDKKLADDAAREVAMSDKIEASVKKGALLCAEKYAVRMEYAPEALLLGGLVIWSGQVALSVRALKTKGAELREKAQQAAP